MSTRIQSLKKELPIVSVLERYGVGLEPEGDRFACLCPFHSEDTASFKVYPADDTFKCYSAICGARGDVIDLIGKLENTDISGAIEAGERLVADPHFTATAKAARIRAAKAPKPRKKWLNPPEAKAHHRYFNGARTHYLTVCRGITEFDTDAKCIAYIKQPDGGWMTGSVPAGRYPYRWEAAGEGSPIIVEGEGTTDKLNSLNVASMSWLGGSSAVLATDWACLKDWPAPVILLADEDDPGRKAMRLLAGHLRGIGCTVLLCMPEGDSGRDIKDYPEAVQSKETVRAFIVERGYERLEPREPEKPAPKKPEPEKFSDGPGTIELDDTPSPPSPPQEPRRGPGRPKGSGKKKAEDDQPPEPPNRDDPQWVSNDEYRLLGITAQDEVMVYQLTSHNIRPVSPKDLYTAKGLNQMYTDEGWWRDMAKGSLNSRAILHGAANIILDKARKMGFYRSGKSFYRGCRTDEAGGVWWHLGDRLLTPGGETVGLNAAPDGMHAIRGATVDIEPTPIESEPLVAALWRATAGYRWYDAAHHAAFMGWLTICASGGALKWRPHVWLVAPATTGKSWLLETILAPVITLLGGEESFGSGESTPAYIKRTVGNDGMPKLLDEMRRPTAGGAGSLENILPYVRGASGGTTAVGMADRKSDDGVITYRPRCCFFMASSIGHDLDDQDASRIATIRLRIDGLSRPKWLEVRDSIHAAMADPRRLTGELMGATPILADLAAKAHDHLTSEHSVSTRLADLLSGLVAGASYAKNPADPEKEMSDLAELMLNLTSEVLGNAAMDLLHTILMGRIRLNVGGEMSVSGLLGGMLTVQNMDRSRARRVAEFGLSTGDDHVS